MLRKALKSYIISFLVILGSLHKGFASDQEIFNNPDTITAIAEHHAEADDHHKKFDPGTFIFDHIGDAHDWHLIDIGKTSIAIPLPVILISKEKGLVVFMSSKFHHGHESYKGFYLHTDGEYKGKIVETLNDGTEVVPFDLSITKNVAALLFSVALILFIFIKIGNAYKRNPLAPPKGLQSLMEPVILFVRDEIARPSIDEKKYEKFMPYLLTVFFFILINNLLGLVPISRVVPMLPAI